jgi:hypothetical protein
MVLKFELLSAQYCDAAYLSRQNSMDCRMVSANITELKRASIQMELFQRWISKHVIGSVV